MQNTGFNYEKELADQDPRDWEFNLGAVKPCLTQGVDLFEFLPQGEVQRGKEDFMDCTNRAINNILETKLTACIKLRLFSWNLIDWLKDNSYSDADGNVKLSDAFNAITSGTTDNGNSLKAGWDAVRKYGAIPKEMLPAETWMLRKDYLDKNRIKQNMYALGMEFLKRISIAYEKVYAKDFFTIDDDIDVASFAWGQPDKNGVYQKVAGNFNHAWDKLKKKPIIKCFDNYYDVDGDFIKQLAPNYTLMDYGFRCMIGEIEAAEELPVVNNGLTIKTVAFATSPKIYMVSNFNPKELLHIDDVPSWNLLKRMGWIKDTKIADEIIQDAYFPHYTILPNDLKIPFKVDVDTNPFTAFIIKLLQSLGIGKKK